MVRRSFNNLARRFGLEDSPGPSIPRPGQYLPVGNLKNTFMVFPVGNTYNL